MNAPVFTYPFTIGTFILLGVVTYKFFQWLLGLSKIDKIRIWKGLFTRKTLKSVKESFLDGLVHVSIFRRNKMLGYMHMSLAFGWFLLIVFGHLEVIFAKGTASFPFYESIFSRYFDIKNQNHFADRFFANLTDFLLLFILSGAFLAYYKRINSRLFGMRRTTKLKTNDRIALISLWLIFPLRLFAESFTAAIKHNGAFLTQPLGNLFATFLPVNILEYPTWFAYSVSLGVFFIFLPASRYSHIPTEIFYIFLRNYGIRLKKKFNSYTNIQVYSCSRCGVCLDVCQLDDANIHTQSVYLIKHLRNNTLSDDVLFNCLLCGKCQQVCPVHIELNNLRITQRIESTHEYNSSYDYLKETKSQKADVVYCAGCMTHLTPGIKKSMIEIMDKSGVNYWFMDEDKAPCCGRPLMQAGQYNAALKLIQNNYNAIIDSGAKKLVLSCPICLKTFIDDYHLKDIEILHHSQFILELVEQGKLPAVKSDKKFVYHDPCELGRGSNVYEEPRQLLEHYGEVIDVKDQKENAMCCGGSLSNIKISMAERDVIKDHVMEYFFSYNPDIMATSCPLCKKTFSRGNAKNIKDIAEIVAQEINNNKVTDDTIKEKLIEEFVF